MVFLYLMLWLRWWYDQIVFPALLNPYTYILLSLWIMIIALVSYLFLSKKDSYRMHDLYKPVGRAILESAGCGFLMTTMFIALYNMAVSLTAQSDFFRVYRFGIVSLATHMPGLTVLSAIMERRIDTILFLFFSSMICIQFVTASSFLFEDERNRHSYMAFIALGSIVTYVICMVLGYV